MLDIALRGRYGNDMESKQHKWQITYEVDGNVCITRVWSRTQEGAHRELRRVIGWYRHISTVVLRKEGTR